MAALFSSVTLHGADSVSSSPMPAVTKAVSEMTFVTGTPMADAQYYIYLFSAFWCGPCRVITPRIVDQYADMKANKVEIIVIGCDRNEKMVKKYVEFYDAGISGLHVDSPHVSSLPGITMPDAIPYAIIVDAAGTVLAQGHASIALNWKEICSSKKAD